MMLLTKLILLGKNLMVYGVFTIGDVSCLIHGTLSRTQQECAWATFNIALFIIKVLIDKIWDLSATAALIFTNMRMEFFVIFLNQVFYVQLRLFLKDLCTFHPLFSWNELGSLNLLVVLLLSYFEAYFLIYLTCPCSHHFCSYIHFTFVNLTIWQFYCTFLRLGGFIHGT